MTHRTHLVRKKHREAVNQVTPTFRVLIERFEGGLTSQKEITRRVLVGSPNKCTEEVKADFAQLRNIALEEGWVKDDRHS